MIKSHILSIATAAFLLMAETAFTQSPNAPGLVVKRAGKTVFTDSATLDKNLRRLVRNDTAVLQLDSAYLISANAAGIVGEYKKKMDSLETLRKELENLRISQVMKYDTIAMKWRRLDSIQEVAYAKLSGLTRHSDSLLTRSINNTDAAISTARSIRRQSYLTSVVLGGVAGLVIDKSALGGGIGALGGLLLNGALLKFEF